MQISEKYTTDPYKDENLDESEIEEYEMLRNLYYYLMAHDKVDETFSMWINKNKNNLDGILKEAKKIHNSKFQAYIK